ncbi:MAG: phosphatidate cytidylyltransferase [Lachnospiraceae bacterium]|nr:phosphatidate cytidylyltransferase [Lachnospiraceae bacterium]
MLKRTISGAVLILVAFASFYFGGYVLFGVTLFLSLLGMFELFRVYKIQWKPEAFVGYLGAIAYYVSLLLEDGEKYFLPGICIFLIFLMICYVFTFPNVPAADMLAVPFALLYAGVLMSFVYKTRMLEGGVYLVWVILIFAWGSDTFAYLVGCSIGKHKAFPRLSPKKTWEGCVGGLLGASLLGAAYGAAFGSKLPDFGSVHPSVVLALTGLLAAVLSMFGDLAASGIKRDHSVKDYGKLIPGHGGVLDRFDSVLFTAPAVYFLVGLFL